MLHVYHHTMSPYSNRVHLLAEELNIPYELTIVALEKGEHRKPAYLKINPYARVPAITLDDFKLSESGAILRFLAEKYERFDLYPKNLEQRAIVDQWIEFTNSHICGQLSDLAWHRYLCHKYQLPADAHEIARSEKELKRDFPILESHLLDRNYLAGSDFTLADLSLIPFMHLHKAAQWSLEPFPSVQKWWDRVSQNKAWKKIKG